MNIEQINTFLKYVPETKPILLVGDSGLGKSAFVRDFAAAIDYKFIDLRLGELEPTDITGSPAKVQLQDGTFITEYGRPFWWPITDKFVLFIDEANRCEPAMHSVGMQLVEQRRAGMRDLPKKGYIFAAINGIEHPETIPMCQSFMRRLAVIDFDPTVDEWITWAIKNNVNLLVVDFIIATRNVSNMLDTPKALIGKPNIVAPTRSGWTEFGAWLDKALPELNTLDGISTHLSPYVGKTAAHTFEKWSKTKYRSINTEDIFDKRYTSAELSSISAMQLAAISSKISKDFLNKSLEQQTNALNIFKEAGAEQFASLFSKLPKASASIVKKIPGMNEYIKENLMVLEKCNLRKDR